MHRSDNFYAEQLLLMTAIKTNGEPDPERMIDTLLDHELKNLPTKSRWVDGSGLSRFNLCSPANLVEVMNRTIRDFGKERLKALLPTGGEGTLKNLLQEDRGFIFAKTGSLSSIICLSGLVETQKGRTFLFSILVNNYTGDASSLKKKIADFIHAMRAKN